MKNLRKFREEYGAGEWGTPELTKKYQDETPGQGLEEAKDYHAIALSASEHAKKQPSATTHKNASAAHEKAVSWHERKINALIKKDGSADEIKKHEQHIKMHKGEAQKHRFNAHRLTKSQQNEGLEDACWKGYEAIGTKQKNGKTVPNCVPKEGHAEDAQTAHKAAHVALKKGDIDTYHKEMDKKFAAHQSGEKEAAKKPVKTFEAAEFKPDAGRLTQIKNDHEGLKSKSTKDVLAIHKSQHRIHSNYTASEIGGKSAMIGDILRYRHGDKHVSHYFGLKELSTPYKDVKEDVDSDEQKNLKITKHSKAAVVAANRGDTRAQQFHLNIVKKLKNESVNEAHKLGDKVKIISGPKDVQGKTGKIGEIRHGLHKTADKTYTIDYDGGSIQLQKKHIKAFKENTENVNEATRAQKHIVSVTVSDPQHTMVTQRKAKILKRVKVSGNDTDEAVARAEAHYKKRGFTVHDSSYHSAVSESLDTDEIIDAKEEPSNDQQLLSMARGQLAEIADMAQELVDSMDETDDLEPWMNSKITAAYVNLDDVHSFIAYGDEYSTDDNSEKKPGLGEAATEIDAEEKTQIAKIQTLIRLGLLEISELAVALRVMKKLASDQPINAVDERKILIKLFSEVTDQLTGDDTVYRRVKMNVQKQ